MHKIIIFWIILYSTNAVALVREFPANTIFAILKSVNYPQIVIQEIPSNWGSSMLGLFFLSSAKMQMTPASVLRDQNNNNQVQNYIYNIINQPVAIQPDYQGRVWLIWYLSNEETQWVINNKYNIWK